MSIFDKYEKLLHKPLDRAETVDYRYVDPEQAGEHEIDEAKEDREILFSHVVFAALIFLLLLWRLFSIQIVAGGENASLAKEHSIRQIVENAKRGGILDSRGVWLARNTPSFRVQLAPGDLPRKRVDRDAVYETLASVLQWNHDDKQARIKEIESKIFYQLDPLVLVDNISHEDALVLSERLNAVAGVSVTPQEVRQYNQPELGLSHILGYVGRVTEADLAKGQFRGTDNVGKTGIEASFDDALRGKNGVTQAVVDSKGKILRSLSDRSQLPQAGHNLVLSIDLKLQTIMASELKAGLEAAGLKAGSAIAMDPQTGAIKAMVSVPTYDNNLFSHGIKQDVYESLSKDPEKPLFNRALQGTFPAGSTIKPFVAAVGLESGVITEKTKIDTPAEIVVGQWKFPNWQHFFIPQVDVKTAIAKSNDIYFYAVGGGWDKIKGLGVDRLGQGLGLFGFGQKTGVALPESAGLIPNEEWKIDRKGETWYIGDTYHMAIGQGDLLVTPLQLTTALSAIANGGKLYKPHIVARIVDQDGNTVSTVEPELIRDVPIKKENIDIVRAGMRQAVTDGSAHQLSTLPVEAAGKTGTAQVGASNEFLHSWFEAFAPYDNPSIVLVVLGERGSEENEGHTTAEPIAKKILEQYFSPDFAK